ncbi:MAG TPA: gliding motility-associated C-terminal domain-containing protein [Bacteroidales bacterium]|nr:gliding motility-associated C-terminal domain-containing protein [Bacteroidales bacterium]
MYHTIIFCLFFNVGIRTTGENKLALFAVESDTLARNSPVIIHKDTISFPTGFRWNRTGPTGGYWQENSIDDHIFRPFFENVEEYSLLVYNRSGMLIYKSSDIHKGWDGYFNNGNLATQGVYIWKASGTFKNGRLFNKTGDVTFVY